MKNKMPSMYEPSFGLSFEAGGAAGGTGGSSSSDGGAGGGSGAGAGGAGGESGGGQPGGGSEAAAGGGAGGAGGSGSAQATSLKDEDLVDVLIDGKPEKVSYKELRSGYSRTGDYTRKTQALADERRRWEQDRQSILETEKQRWAREQQEEATRRAREEQTDPAQRALSETQSLHQRLEDQALDIALSRLPLKDKGVDERELLMQASAYGITTADGLAKHGQAILDKIVAARDEGFNGRFADVLKKGDNPELVKFVEAKIKEYLSKKGAGPTPPSTGAGAGSSGASGARKARTFDEAADIAAEMLAGAQP